MIKKIKHSFVKEEIRCDVCNSLIDNMQRTCFVCGLDLCDKCFIYSSYDGSNDVFCLKCFDLCEPFLRQMNEERDNFDCIISKIEKEMVKNCKKNGVVFKKNRSKK